MRVLWRREMDFMKSIMVFGDSITWGLEPVTRARLPLEARWPMVLEAALAGAVRVHEEALCDRTTIWDDPFVPGRNGKDTLAPLLDSHAPLDLLAIMLGTNDLQRHFGKSAHEAALGVGTLVEVALKSAAGPGGGAPEILLIAPPPFGPLAPYQKLFFAGNEAEAGEMGAAMKVIALVYGAHFVDARSVVTSGADGIHLDSENHAKLGAAVAEKIRAIPGFLG